MRISDWSSDVCSSDLCRQVEDDAALAADVELEHGVVVHGAAEERPECACRVAGGRFDLDDVGAPVGQQARRSRHRHPQARKRAAEGKSVAASVDYGCRPIYQKHNIKLYKRI